MLGISDLLKKSQYDFDDLVSIMSILRDKEIGCPWDIKQTHSSIRNNFIEETYEAVEAIDDGDSSHLLEELGDVLLQVVFHAEIARSEDAFDIDDVCDGICKKLILRHPHVFGQVVVRDDREVLQNWDEIKKVEKSQKTVTDTLRSVSKTMPSLMRAAKLRKKAEKGGLKTVADAESICSCISQQLGAVQNGAAPDIGALLLNISDLSRLYDVDAEEALYNACENFIEEISGKEIF